MNRIKEVTLILSIIINIVLGYILYSRNRIEKEPNPTILIEKIDSLELKLAEIRTKRDSINKDIDTVFIKLKVVEKQYEKKYNDILTNSTSEDYVFFTNYLEQNRARFDSINNF